MMMPKIVIGGQWGDEGKGKIVDFLAKDADIVVRFNGGNNAGHTIVYNGEKFPLSLLPSGVLREKELLISQGVVLNPKVLLSEIAFFKKRGLKINLKIDYRCHLVMPYHQLLDAATEEFKGKNKVGSLKLGIGYCYEDRNNRHGIRFEDLVKPKVLKEKIEEFFPLVKKRIEGVFNYPVSLTAKEIFREYETYGKQLKPYLADVSLIVNENLKKKKILFEGAHGTFLDGNFGTYPFTTAINTISGSVFTGVGFPPQKLEVVGVVKAYTTRVGQGPFPTELFDKTGEFLQENGGEIGTVSKRKRRCGWLDLEMLKFAHRLNGFNYLIFTKLDVLSGLKNLQIATHYNHYGKPVYLKIPGWSENLENCKKFSDLPKNCQNYIETIERIFKIPVKYLSLGAERKAVIKR